MSYFFIFALSFTFQWYISGRKSGAKGYVGPEFGYFVILTRDVCIEIDLYCIICNCKSLQSFQFIRLILCRQFTDILKMCMKKFHAEKYFETDLHIFVNLSVLAGHTLSDA